MSLFSRLTIPSAGEERLPIHMFLGKLARAINGEENISLVKNCTKLALSADEKTVMTALYNAVDQGSQNNNNVVITLELISYTLHAGLAGGLTEQEIADSLTVKST